MSSLAFAGRGRRARRRLRTADVLGGDLGSAVASQKMLGGTFLAAIATATIGQTRGGLPSPRRYAAIVLLWFVFGLVAELGRQPARFVGALAALVTLAMAMGTAGKRALGWLGATAVDLQAAPQSAAESQADRAAAGLGGPLVGGGAPRTGAGRRVRPGGGGGSGGFG